MENEFTIGAAIITRDRLPQLKKLLPQLGKLDQIVVVDTSPVPDKKTQTYIKTLGKKYGYHHFPWRPEPENYDPNDWGFAAARNESFKYLKTTHALWLDTDDLLGVAVGTKSRVLTAKEVGEGLRNIINNAPEVDMWYVNYHYGHDEFGNVTARHARERIFKLDKQWQWVYPIHECAIPQQPSLPRRITDIVVIHNQEVSDKESTERNFTYLKKWYDQLMSIDENHFDMPRCKFQLGLSMWGLGKHRESAEWLKHEFIDKHPQANILTIWDAYNFIWRNYWELGDLDNAEEAALNGINICPQYAESYIFLARTKLAKDGDPKAILKLLEYTAAAEDTPAEVIINPLDQTFFPYLVAAVCKHDLGDYDGALHWIQRALDIVPNDQKALWWYQQIVTKVKEKAAKDAAIALYNTLRDFEENEKASRLYELLPYAIQENEEIRSVALAARERTAHLRNDEEYEKLYQEGGRYDAISEEQFEEGFVPGEDRFAYIVKRLRLNPSIKTVLDVGCSDGFHTLALARLGYQVVGIDLDPKAVEVANERAKKHDLPATFVHGFFERMEIEKMVNPYTGEPFEHGFDAVISEEVIEHVQDPQFFLDCLGDCAKENAPIIVTTPDGSFGLGLVPEEDINNRSVHVRAYTQSTMEALTHLSPQYRVMECHHLTWKADPSRGWLAVELRRALRPGGPKIRVFVGNGNSWNPDDVDGGGIGGSETAVVHMTRAWSALGCQVAVYGAQTGIWDGVYYRNVEDWNSEHESDIFIAWRLPQIFDFPRPNAKHTILWAHDLYYPTGITEEAADRIDTVAVLSEFHQGYMEGMHPTIKGKCWVTRNGIAVSRYEQEVEKVPHRYFYSSSYDRGLKELLTIHWPKIKEAIPDAELHVAYGLQTAREICRRDGNLEKLAELEALVTQMEELDGVVHHDRMSQVELAKLQLSCEAWLYPPHHFLETYCITALEAQAAECVPVSRINGAVGEVLQHRVEWKEDSDIVDLLVNKVPKFINSTKLARNRVWARKQTWNALAIEWLQQFSPKETEE